MALLSKTKSSDVLDMLGRLEDQMRSMQLDIDTRLDAIAEDFEVRRTDDEAATLAAERIRSGAAERTRDGAEVLAELGIHAH